MFFDCKCFEKQAFPHMDKSFLCNKFLQIRSNLSQFSMITLMEHYYFSHASGNLFWFSLLQFGALSVVVRQTNIIWMLFVACTGVIDITLAHQRDNKKADDFDESIRKSGQPSPNISITGESKLRKRKFGTGVETDNDSTPSRSVSSTAHMSGLICHLNWILIICYSVKTFKFLLSLPRPTSYFSICSVSSINTWLNKEFIKSVLSDSLSLERKSFNYYYS